MTEHGGAAWTWRLLRCGGFRLDGGSMFGMVPRVVWTRWVTPDDRNRIPLQTNSLLLTRGDRVVLVEVGIGDKMGDKERDMYDAEPRSVLDAVREAGVAPEDVTDVIVTHLHFDHAGGLTRRPIHGESERPQISFPNVRIIVQRREWEDAKANRSTMHKTYLPEHLTGEVQERLVLMDTPAPVTDELATAPSYDRWFSFDAVPGLDGIEVFRTPGHTWGQQAVKIDAGDGRELVYVPDVMPTANHAGPTHNMSYDVEPYVSMMQRVALLEEAARRRWLLVLDHEPGEPLRTAEPDPQRPDRKRLAPADA